MRGNVGARKSRETRELEGRRLWAELQRPCGERKENAKVACWLVLFSCLVRGVRAVCFPSPSPALQLSAGKLGGEGPVCSLPDLLLCLALSTCCEVSARL